jgi:hypothetical protein
VGDKSGPDGGSGGFVSPNQGAGLAGMDRDGLSGHTSSYPRQGPRLAVAQLWFRRLVTPVGRGGNCRR